MIDVAEFAKNIAGSKTLERKFSKASYLHEIIRTGFPYAPFESVLNRLGLSRAQVAAALGLPERTLARRKKERKFQPRESDTIFRFLRIAAHAMETLGSDENAGLWLANSNVALGGAKPLDLLDTEVGAQEVDEVLGRIDYGIYS